MSNTVPEQLRDYFAAHAIDRCIDVMAQFVMEEASFRPNEHALSDVVRRGVKMAYFVADTMLEHREKKK